ncbi:hypothetical protein EVAR_66640_1 [Eumeta japonica]|uniref:Uncharacterized protein n=1 Tax=Eumeta variegata TaxID=151549 RepID=A0A4C1ZYS0_EUMVA|nr:hypothetical protein EVAR_66640_1 [Eumeta japonica]
MSPRVPMLKSEGYQRNSVLPCYRHVVVSFRGFFNLVAGDCLDRIYLFSSDRETLKQNTEKRMGKKKGHTMGEAAWSHSLRARPLPFFVLVQCLDHRLDKFTEIKIDIQCPPNAREPSHKMSHTKNYMCRGDINFNYNDR